MKQYAFVYYTHLLSDIVVREIDRLCSELPDTYDIWVIGCVDNARIYDGISNFRVKKQAYTREDLNRLPYKEKLRVLKPGSTRGSNDLAIMSFFRTHPNYETYWIAEYDVRYSGSWQKLLFELEKSNADLICTHLIRFIHDENWVHWSTLKSPVQEVSRAHKIRGFLPFSRVTGRLLQKIDGYCTSGWSGHYEVLWPTIANLEKFPIEEIGGNTEFTPPARRGRFYHSSFVNSDLFISTFSAWPVYDESSNFDQHIKDTLWHPVKTVANIPTPKAIAAKVSSKWKGSETVAIVTMAYNEPDFLPLWYKYYSGQVGPQHCYVIDHGSDDDSIAETQIENRVYLPRTAVFEDKRCKFITSFCEGLLGYYDTVIYTDIDEFLVPDPARFGSLLEFCEASSEPVITALGLNLLHRFNHDTPILPGRAILEQRSWAFASAAMSKPFVIRRPVKWTKGFHSYDGPMVFDGLINFHLPLYDYHTALRRQAKRRQAASEMTDVGSHHQMTDDELTTLFVSYSAMKVEDSVTLDADCPASQKFIKEMQQSVLDRKGQYYEIDLSLKGNQLWKIPDSYRSVF